MGEHNRFCFGGDGPFNQIRIYIVCFFVDINEDWNRTKLRDRVNRCREPGSNSYYFITLLDSTVTKLWRR